MAPKITKLFLVAVFTSNIFTNYFNKSFDQKHNSVYSVTLNKDEYQKAQHILKENFTNFPTKEENGKINYTEHKEKYFLSITLKKKKLKIEFVCKNEDEVGDAIAIAYRNKIKGLTVKIEEIKARIEALDSSSM